MSFLRIIKGISLSTIVFFGAWGCSSGSGGMGPGPSDPVAILAPVSGLISISSPASTNGVTQIKGLPGVVLPFALVEVTNTQTGQTVQATALSDGSFRAEIPTSVGNALQIRQTSNVSSSLVKTLLSPFVKQQVSQTSPITTRTVPLHVPPLEGSPVAIAIDSDLNIGFVVSSDGTNSYFDAFALENKSDGIKQTLSNFVANDIAYDFQAQNLYISDFTRDRVAVFALAGSGNFADLSVNNPVALATSTDFTRLFVGVEEAAVGIRAYDASGLMPQPETAFAIPHPTNGSATHVRTDVVHSYYDSFSGDLYLGALSRFSNGDTVFTRIHYLNGITDQVNLGAGTFTDLKLLNLANEAVISDTDHDSVIYLTSSDPFSSRFDRRTNIAVGDSPRGLDVDDVTQIAFVTNNTSHSVSVIELTDAQVAATFSTLGNGETVGLGPVDIVIQLENSFQSALIANNLGETASIVDLEQVLNP